MMRFLWTVLMFVALPLALACTAAQETAPEPLPSQPPPAATAAPSAGPSAASPAPGSPAPQAAPRRLQLSYVGEDGGLWVRDMEPPGGARRLTDAGACNGQATMDWSPDGALLACLALKRPAEPAALTLFGRDGAILLQTFAAGSFAWSPSGRYLAYVSLVPEGDAVAARYTIVDRNGSPAASLRGALAPAGAAPPSMLAWFPDEERVAYRGPQGAVIAGIASGQTEPLPGELSADLLPLAVVLGERALLAGSGCSSLGCSQAVLLDLATGIASRLPDLDGRRDLWLSPDRATVAVTARQGDALGLTLVDLAGRAAKAIPGARISYPGEGIPRHQVRFAPDGGYLYWYDGDAGVQRARIDSSAATVLAKGIPAFTVSFSPDVRKIAYTPLTSSRSGTLHISNTDGSGGEEIVTGGPFAWRLLPAPGGAMAPPPGERALLLHAGRR